MIFIFFPEKLISLYELNKSRIFISKGYYKV